ncbi:MAG: response regulator [Acidimicrobiales bacterium]
MKILIVDDSKAMRMIVKRTLRQADLGDHDTEEAGDGTEAIPLIDSWCPDLVLSDWNMPEMNGIDLLRHVRASGNTVRFGFVTSEGTDDMRQLASDEGAEFLITKPFDPDSFTVALGRNV